MHTEYEYKTWRNPNSAFMGESILEGHKFGYIKRRRLQSQSTFKEYQPKCSCKTKIWKDTWCVASTGTRAREAALHLFNNHVKTMRETQPRLPI